MPLQRFLRAQVGRPWSKVYSELCARLDRTTVSGAHVFSHLADLVMGFHEPGKDSQLRRVEFLPIGKRPWPHLTNGFRPGPLHNRLYIHPRTGRLCFAGKPPVPTR